MKKLFIILTLCLAAACSESTTEKTRNANASFDTYKKAFIDRYWNMYPAYASAMGYHRYDSVLFIPDAAFRRNELEFLTAELKTLRAFGLESLSTGNQTDFHLIENNLESRIWEQQTFRSYEWDPSGYNVCGIFAEMINNQYDKPETRLRSISQRLVNVPGFYAAAKKNIQHPTKEHTQLAIDQNLGGLSVFTSDLIKATDQSGLSAAEKDTLKARSRKAEEAITDYAAWLKGLENNHPRTFRLGKKLYAEKFAFDLQSAASAEQMYRKALKHKQELHADMIAVSHKIWAKHMGQQAKPADELLMVRQLIDRLSLKHSKPEAFQSDIEAQLPELVKFVNEHQLLYLDPAKPLVVRREPGYMAGVAGVSISSPGPYDKTGNTYYNVGSFNGWTPEATESYLREYNDYVLQILNIHEAIPGHYTQLIYSNRSPGIIKAIFGNTTMIEGWAVYTERMMLENGYGNNEPEMWLMYYKWNLRTTCNTILDYSVHNLGLQKEQALDFLVSEAFQQQAEAEGKWKRATLTQVQLCSYFTGYSEICDLREELKKKQGKAFALKAFHEQFLSYGSAPVKYIRELMLGN